MTPANIYSPHHLAVSIRSKLVPASFNLQLSAIPKSGRQQNLSALDSIDDDEDQQQVLDRLRTPPRSSLRPDPSVRLLLTMM